MARTKKKSDDVENADFVGGFTEEVPVVEETAPEEVAPAIETPVTEPASIEPVLIVKDFDAIKELNLAHSEIQHCLDYTEIPGADYKGYFRGKLREWRMYAYKVRQYSIHGGNAPTRPESVEDRY